MEESSFCFAFFGEGYSEGQDPSQGKPNTKIRTLVQGPGLLFDQYSIQNIIIIIIIIRSEAQQIFKSEIFILVHIIMMAAGSDLTKRKTCTHTCV